MRSLRIGIGSLCGLLCLSLVPVTAVSAEGDDFASKFSPTLDSLMKDKDTAKWVDKELYDVIKHGLDRRMAKVIAEHEWVKKYRVQIDELMSDLGDYGRNLLRSRGAEASFANSKEGVPAQYASIRNTAQRIAKFFNFSKEMRSKLNVFVLDTPVVNAFAYPSFDTIEIAIFTGLIERLNREGAPITEVGEMVKGVIAHELAHVKNKHSEQRIIAMLIFFMTLKNIIPPSLQANFTALVKDQTIRSLYNIDPQQALASQQGDTFRQLFDYTYERIEQSAESLLVQSNMQPGLLEAFQSELNTVFSEWDAVAVAKDTEMSEEGKESRALSPAEIQAGEKLLARYGIVPTAENAAAEGQEGAEARSQDMIKAGSSGFILELIRFVLALGKLSRSHEVTSDRFEQIVTSEQTVQESFARIGGGRDANPKAMMRQAEKWAEDLNKEKRLQIAINEDFFQTHPVTLMRIYQAMLFSESAGIKVHKNTIYKALTLYMEGIKILEKSEQVLEGTSTTTGGGYNYSTGARESVADSKEAYELYLEGEKATPYKQIVSKLGEVIVNNIIAENATSSTDINLERFAELIDFLQSFKKDRGDYALPKKRLSTPGTEGKIEGALYTLNLRLRHLDDMPASEGQQSQLVKDALELLRPYQPVGTRWELDENTGKWMQIESTNTDTERRRLEEFRRKARQEAANKRASKQAKKLR